MKRLVYLCMSVLSLVLAQACHPNPNNTFGGPSNRPQDTSISRRDTSSAGDRADR
ncbi:hypothetical protein [Mucilaginibacter koreensis]